MTPGAPTDGPQATRPAPPARPTRQTPAERQARLLETGLAVLVLAALPVYATALLLLAGPPALGDPLFVDDLLALALLLFGALHSLRARPARSAGALCGALGFSTCLAWRAFFGRLVEQDLVQRGLLTLDASLAEPAHTVPVMGAAFGVSVVGFTLAWVLCVRRPR